MKALVPILLSVLALAGHAQRSKPEPRQEDVPTVLQKQIAIDQFETQIRATPMAAVRVFARLRLATRLWSSEKDETGRADGLVTLAITDLYDKKDEIPPEYFDRLNASLFVLLDRNSKEISRKLRATHNATAGELQALNLLPSGEGNDLRATDSAIRSIGETGSVDTDVLPLLIQLRTRNLTQYERLLNAIVQASETGGMTNSQAYILADEFMGTQVSVTVQKRFAKIVFERCRVAAYATTPDSYFLELLSKVMPALSAHLPQLVPEASTVMAVLRSRLSATARSSAERHERISKSADKIAAYLSEADDASDRAVKYEMYVLAAQLALRESKFLTALKILDKVDEILLPYGDITKEFRNQWRASFLIELVEAALKDGETEAANMAILRMENPLTKADMFRKMAASFVTTGSMVSAKESLNEAIKLATKQEANFTSTLVLVRSIPVGQKIDPSGIVHLNREIGKAVGSLSNPSDSFASNPKQHLAYIKGILDLSWNLLPAAQTLAKSNRLAANDLAERIDNKELRLVADLGLLIQSFDDRPLSTAGY